VRHRRYAGRETSLRSDCVASYRWHWRAFLAGGGSAVWLFAYGLFWYAQRLSLGSVSGFVLYLGYLVLLSLLDFLVTGKHFICIPLHPHANN
jgi:hypothetical protein